MQNQCNLNVRSKCILNALRIRKGKHQFSQQQIQRFPPFLELLLYRYCLCLKCLIFINKQEKGTCQNVRHISVSDTIPRLIE